MSSIIPHINYAMDKSIAKQRSPQSRLINGIYEKNLDQVKQAISDGANIEEEKELKGIPGLEKVTVEITPLSIAVMEGARNIVEFLLSKGANVNFQEDFLSFTPLMIATSSGRLDLAKLLLMAGANPALKNARGETAFELGQQQLDKIFNQTYRSTKIKAEPKKFESPDDKHYEFAD